MLFSVTCWILEQMVSVCLDTRSIIAFEGATSPKHFILTNLYTSHCETRHLYLHCTDEETEAQSSSDMLKATEGVKVTAMIRTWKVLVLRSVLILLTNSPGN